MRVNNKGGFTPRDRRLDRRKVATAAAIAAVLLFATQARAALVNFVVDTAASSISVDLIQVFEVAAPTQQVRLVDVSGAASYGEPDPSNENTSASGWIVADIIPGAAITFQSGVSRINYANQFDYRPFQDVNGNWQSAGGGIPVPSQMGFEEQLSFDSGGTWPATGQGYGKIWDMYTDFGTPSTGTVDGGSTLGYFGLPLGSGPYIGADVALMAMDGFLQVIGSFNADAELATAGPLDTPFAVVFAGNSVTYDGTTLSIPLNFSINFIDDGQDWTVVTSGLIVATKHVPEPSSIIMLGIGVLGLAGCFVRARKRRV